MRFRKTWGAFVLTLLAITPAAQAANELEAVLGYYFPSTVELEQLNVDIDYQDTLSYGLRYGYRFEAPWGLSVSWTHVDLDAANPESFGCSTCDFDVDFADFSLEWYPGGHDWSLYAGLGWATGEIDVDVAGDSNDFSLSDDAFTWHLGTAWAWRIGESFFIRPDARFRFLELDESGRGKYDTEDPELRLGFGWRF